MSLQENLIEPLQLESAEHGSIPEWKAVECLSRAFITLLSALDLDGVPTVLARMYEVLVAFIIAFRIDEELWAQGVMLQEKDKNGQFTGKKYLNPLVEQSAKAHERLRKAMKELEDTCAKAGKPINEGLPDKVRDLMKKAELAIEKMFEAQADGKDDV